MMMPDSPRDASLLQQENATLREMNKTLQAQIGTLTQRIEQLTQDNAVLRLKVDAMAAAVLLQSYLDAHPG